MKLISLFLIILPIKLFAGGVDTMPKYYEDVEKLISEKYLNISKNLVPGGSDGGPQIVKKIRYFEENEDGIGFFLNLSDKMYFVDDYFLNSNPDLKRALKSSYQLNDWVNL